MPYVVTQACCADASCVLACPVNCIHPSPGEPGFATAEMLHVDPDTCVDCGACATACPVDAIKPHTTLADGEQPFVALNAAYYARFPHADRAPMAPVPPQRRLADPGPFRVAVVGAGPAGLYVADELLTHPELTVDVYDRLPTPYGLVRAGVAPDHLETKRVDRLFRAVEDQPGFRYFLGVEVGRDLTLPWLRARYHAVVHAGGASADRRLGVPGEDLPGSLSATELVGWYNGHPDHQDLRVPLAHERAVVVGNGNVALDVARILTADPATLERTDVAALPWAALARSAIREVVVLGRRGPAEAAFTLTELLGLAALVERGEIDVRVEAPPGSLGDDERSRVLARLADRPRTPGRRTVVFAFRAAPVRLLGGSDASGGVRGVEVALPGGGRRSIEAGLVLRSVGYRGLPVPGLAHDPASGTVPHERGRVEPGLYVAGWAKRGPSGFIGTNKTCAQETVAALLDDLDRRRELGLAEPEGDAASVARAVADRCPGVVDLAGWRALDAEERRRGEACGAPRRKVVDVAEMRRIARGAKHGPAAGYAAHAGRGRRPGRSTRGGDEQR